MFTCHMTDQILSTGSNFPCLTVTSLHNTYNRRVKEGLGYFHRLRATANCSADPTGNSSTIVKEKGKTGKEPDSS